MALWKKAGSKGFLGGCVVGRAGTSDGGLDEAGAAGSSVLLRECVGRFDELDLSIGSRKTHQQTTLASPIYQNAYLGSRISSTAWGRSSAPVSVS